MRLNVLNNRLLVAFLLFIACQSSMAQTALTAITGTYTDKNNAANDYTATSPSNAGQQIDDNTTYDIFFARNTTTDNNLEVTSYSIGATTYSFLLDPDTLALRRLGTATRLSLWIEAEGNVDNTLDEIYLRPERQVPERSLYQANLLNIGYDNVLVNTGTNSSNIERIDAIYRTGMLTSTPSEAIIPVMDRGGNGVFDIAVILSLDANGDPASYGDLIAVDAGDFGTNLVTFANSVLFLQQALGEGSIPTGSSTQNLGGVGISFADLGVAANQIIYGYSLFSEDVDDAIHTLTDISTFPTDSDNSGLDMGAGAVSAVSSDGNLVKANGPGGYKASLNTWLKANVGVTTATDNSSVTLWDDQSLGDHDATTLTTAPTYRDGSASGLQDINFNPTVDFIAATERGLQIANNSDYNEGGEPYTRKAFNIAFRTDGTNITTRQQLYEQGGASRGIGLYIEGGEVYVTAWNQPDDDGAGSASPWNTAGTIDVVSTTVNTDTEYIVTMEFNGSSDGTGTITGYLNGQSFGTISSVGQLFDHADDIGLGDINGASRYEDNTTAASSFYGSIPEFIYCSEPASFPLNQRRKIESYLALKYGITLDQTTAINYVNSNGSIIFNTSNAASIGGYLEYNNDIAGIGRDDASEFEQKTSQSENAGSLVRMARNGDIGVDNTWMIWGNDGGALTETATGTPDTIDFRLTRVWRVAEEKSMGVTDISFDINDLGLGTNANEFSLLIGDAASAGDFSSGTVLTGGTTSTIDGRTFITFSNVNLTDGQYFTLGTDFAICSPGGVEENLRLWLRADENVFNTGTTPATDGQTVATWGDRSVLENDATDGDNLTTFETNTVNFNPAIEFNNDATSLQGSLTTNAAGLTIISAGFINSASGTDDALIELRGGTADDRSFFINSRYAGNNNYTTNLNEDSWNIWSVDHPSGFTANIYQNNATFESPYTTTLSDAGAGVYNYTLGDDDTGGNDFVGFIGDMIVYEGTLTANQRLRVESYLAVKYGVTLNQGTATNYLASDGGTIWDATTNAAYNDDIAGIGRDDGSCFEQKQSISQNADAIVTMGLGTIANDNAANPNNFANDDSFLVWGNDNASTTFAGRTTGVTGTGTVTERMTRIWRADENLDVGTTSISFNLSTLGYGNTLSDYQLIISDNSDLSASTQYPAASIDGDVITFTGINIADGQYFTLGTARTECGPGGITGNLYVWLRADAGTSTTTNNTTVDTWPISLAEQMLHQTATRHCLKTM